MSVDEIEISFGTVVHSDLGTAVVHSDETAFVHSDLGTAGDEVHFLYILNWKNAPSCSMWSAELLLARSEGSKIQKNERNSTNKRTAAQT